MTNCLVVWDVVVIALGHVVAVVGLVVAATVGFGHPSLWLLQQLLPLGRQCAWAWSLSL